MASITPRKSQEANVPAAPSASLRPSLFDRFEPFRTMRDLLRWDPFQEMAPMFAPNGMNFSPDFEVIETPQSYVFKGDLPGVTESDIDISVSGNQLTIRGKREHERKEESENCYCSERAYGAFTRMFTLPQGVDMNQATADYQNGVLTLTVPKSPESQPRKIALGAGSEGNKAARA